MDKAAYEELDGAIMEVGRIWANSSNRPKPTTEVLVAWDKLLDDWISSNLPLILRDSRRRGKDAECSDGQKVFFADNFPANWAFSSALYHSVPDIRNWDGDTLSKHVPLSILSNGDEYKRIPNLNKEGWKVCHIKPVSDGKRSKVEEIEIPEVEAAFRRFLSPRNIFLIPKKLSGAGELPQIIEAIRKVDGGLKV